MVDIEDSELEYHWLRLCHSHTLPGIFLKNSSKVVLYELKVWGVNNSGHIHSRPACHNFIPPNIFLILL